MYFFRNRLKKKKDILNFNTNTHSIKFPITYFWFISNKIGNISAISNGHITEQQHKKIQFNFSNIKIVFSKLRLNFPDNQFGQNVCSPKKKRKIYPIKESMCMCVCACVLVCWYILQSNLIVRVLGKYRVLGKRD